MSETLSKALVLTMLQHAEDFHWRMQDIGLMGLRLDDRREYRLHVWDPSNCVGEPPIHDHPYDFTSTIIAGESVSYTHLDVYKRQIKHRRRLRWSPPTLGWPGWQ